MILGQQPTVIANNATLTDFDDGLPVETQSAQCTITAGDVQASAQASVSKKLEGVCGSSKFFWTKFYF